MEAPACACHNEPQRWNKDPRYTAGGFWKCAAKGVAYQRDRYASDPSYRGRAIARHRRNWHRPDGGYVQRRRRQLAAQRAQILDQLAQLREERAKC